MKRLTITTLILGTAGLALAGDPKLAPKAGAAKPDMKAAAPPIKMEMPKPAQEVADMAKAMTGTWKCDGTGAGMDGKDMKFVGSMKSKADLGGFWVHDSFLGTMGEAKTSMPFTFESFSTFDSSSKKWRVVFVDSMGGQMIGTSDGMKDMKMDTMFDSVDGRGKGMSKDHVDMTDLKKGAHMWGEESRDGGKTWNKVYDMTCKK